MKRKIRLVSGSGITFFMSLSLVKSVFAADLNPPTGYTALGTITFDSVIKGILQILLFLGFFLAMVFLLIGGIRWIASGGDKAAAESARGTLTAAIIGLIIVLATWAIVNIIEGMFGINIVGASITLPKFTP